MTTLSERLRQADADAVREKLVNRMRAFAVEIRTAFTGQTAVGAAQGVEFLADAVLTKRRVTFQVLPEETGGIS